MLYSCTVSLPHAVFALWTTVSLIHGNIPFLLCGPQLRSPCGKKGGGGYVGFRCEPFMSFPFCSELVLYTRLLRVLRALIGASARRIRVGRPAAVSLRLSFGLTGRMSLSRRTSSKRNGLRPPAVGPTALRAIPGSVLSVRFLPVIIHNWGKVSCVDAKGSYRLFFRLGLDKKSQWSVISDQMVREGSCFPRSLRDPSASSGLAMGQSGSLAGQMGNTRLTLFWITSGLAVIRQECPFWRNCNMMPED